jgi:hypothetical protein
MLAFTGSTRWDAIRRPSATAAVRYAALGAAGARVRDPRTHRRPLDNACEAVEMHVAELRRTAPGRPVVFWSPDGYFVDCAS